MYSKYHSKSFGDSRLTNTTVQTDSTMNGSKMMTKTRSHSVDSILPPNNEEAVINVGTKYNYHTPHARSNSLKGDRNLDNYDKSDGESGLYKQIVKINRNQQNQQNKQRS
jgi:hypothetical protein